MASSTKPIDTYDSISSSARRRSVGTPPTGAAAGAVFGVLGAGLACGVLGAVLGTYIGAAVRAGLARAFGRDLPAALIEDVIAVGGALLLLHCHL